jgi:hypothetical protein
VLHGLSRPSRAFSVHLDGSGMSIGRIYYPAAKRRIHPKKWRKNPAGDGGVFLGGKTASIVRRSQDLSRLLRPPRWEDYLGQQLGTAVAIVFERVNQRGVELDTVQLLSAWTWSGDFDLNQRFEELASELTPFGFKDVGSDKDLLLRCCSAVMLQDPSPDSLISLNGAKVRDSFEHVVTGIKGAIDFVRKNLHVESLDNLPYDNLLVPLTVFFAGEPTKQKKVTNAQRKEILRWFWHTCIHRKYNSQPIKSLREDVVEFAKLADGSITKLTHPDTGLSNAYFLNNTFRLNSVVSRMFILLLAQKGPRSFLRALTILKSRSAFVLGPRSRSRRTPSRTG